MTTFERLSIGQQDDNLRAAVALTQAVDGCRQAITYGCAIVYNTRTQTSHSGEHLLGVGRQGRGRVCLTGKSYQRYAVALPAGNKLRRHTLRYGYAVGLEVACKHRARDIHRNDNVNTLARGGMLLTHYLWACQRHHHSCHRRHT